MASSEPIVGAQCRVKIQQMGLEIRYSCGLNCRHLEAVESDDVSCDRVLESLGHFGANATVDTGKEFD